MTRVSTCSIIRQKKEHEWRQLESAPNFRTCPDLKMEEEVDGGCCEMAPGGTCLYVGKSTLHRVTKKGDGKRRWDADDFERVIKGREAGLW
jgi:hypothetical protein